MQSQTSPRDLLIGALCGAGASLGWAAGFVAAKHGLAVGFTPADIALHRFLWSGLLLIPLAMRDGLSDLGGLGWWRGLLIAVIAGPGQAMLAYTGFTLVPLGHGVVIQPACATLFGLLFATLLLGETLTPRRVAGAIAVIVGLCVFAGEAVATIGAHGVVGDLLFAAAGVLWAMFGTLLRKWRVAGMHAAAVVGFLSVLLFTPLFAAIEGFGNIMRVSLAENLLQAVVQGLLAGAGPIFLFARAVSLLGAGRAGTFPALVPGFSLVIGYAALGNIPTLAQVAGFAVVIFGFWLVMRRS